MAKTSIPKVTQTQILVGLLVVAAFIIGILFPKNGSLFQGTGTSTLTQPSTGAQATPVPGQKVNVSAGHLPILGKSDAKVTVIEFADFRCPFCEKFFTDSEPSILSDYVNTGKVKFAFRHYAFLGPASTVAANAAECANEQNKFWDFHNYLYKNQPSESDTSMYTVNNLSTIAGNLGMNASQFSSCLSSNKYQKNVDADFADGQKAGVSGTPTLFINGQMMVGAQPYTSFKQTIDQALK